MVPREVNISDVLCNESSRFDIFNRANNEALRFIFFDLHWHVSAVSSHLLELVEDDRVDEVYLLESRLEGAVVVERCTASRVA